MGPKKKSAIRFREELRDWSFVFVGTLTDVSPTKFIVKITVDYVAKFGGILCLQDRREVAKVYETFGTIRDYWVAAKPLESININDYAIGTKFYMTGNHLVPLINFFPPQMRNNFKYTPQEGDIQRRKREKKKPYKPVPQRDISGVGYDYVPSGSDGRCYVAEGPICRTGLVNIQKSPVTYGQPPPNNSVKEQVLQVKKGRGTFVSTALPPVGSNPPQAPIIQATQAQQIIENKLNDTTFKVSETNITDYSRDMTSAIPNPQYQQNTQPSLRKPHDPSYFQTTQQPQTHTVPDKNWRGQNIPENIETNTSQAHTNWQQRDSAGNEQGSNWRAQGRPQYTQESVISHSSGIGNLTENIRQIHLSEQVGQYAARQQEPNYGQYTRDIQAQAASTSFANFSMHGRLQEQSHAIIHTDNQQQFADWHRQQSARYDDHTNRLNQQRFHYDQPPGGQNINNPGQHGGWRNQQITSHEGIADRVGQHGGHDPVHAGWRNQQAISHAGLTDRGGPYGRSYDQPPGGQNINNPLQYGGWRNQQAINQAGLTDRGGQYGRSYEQPPGGHDVNNPIHQGGWRNQHASNQRHPADQGGVRGRGLGQPVVWGRGRGYPQNHPEGRGGFRR